MLFCTAPLLLFQLSMTRDLVERGLKILESGQNWDQVRTTLKKRAEEDPEIKDDRDYLIITAAMAVAVGDISQAMSRMEQIGDEPKKATKNLLKIVERYCTEEQEYKLISKLLTKYPKSRKLLKMKAEGAMDMGRWKTAYRLLERLQKRDPKNKWVRSNLKEAKAALKDEAKIREDRKKWKEIREREAAEEGFKPKYGAQTWRRRGGSFFSKHSPSESEIESFLGSLFFVL